LTKEYNKIIKAKASKSELPNMNSY
jgi:hypothetical protein